MTLKYLYLLPRVIGDDRVSKAGLARHVTGIQTLCAYTDARLCTSTQFLLLQHTSMSIYLSNFYMPDEGMLVSHHSVRADIAVCPQNPGTPLPPVVYVTYPMRRCA